MIDISLEFVPIYLFLLLTVAPKTSPALIKIKFLMIYWPSKVGTKGKIVNVSLGNRTNGVNVPSICANNRNNIVRKYLPIIKPTPIIVSQAARIIIDALAGIRPNDNLDIVSVANISAELTLGKNLRTPNQKNINPTLIRKNNIPYLCMKLII